MTVNDSNGDPVASIDGAGAAVVTGFKLPTGAGAGKLLACDAQGNASWKTVAEIGLVAWVEEQDVSANDAGWTTTHETDVNKSYRITFSNVWIVGNGPWGSIHGDAFYREGSRSGAYDATDVVIGLDGQAITPRPAFVSSHVYTITISGTGTHLAFECLDGNQGDNSGAIHVRVEELL